jgi:hypothetical protein
VGVFFEYGRRRVLAGFRRLVSIEEFIAVWALGIREEERGDEKRGALQCLSWQE